MGTCIYCGKPAGLFRKRHRECQAQHDAAVQTIPEFFIKMASSSLSATRFGELLRNAAAASYISPDEFKRLSIAGVANLIDAKLTHDLISVDDEDRIYEIASAVDLTIAEVPALDERFAKIATLRDLDAGNIPDRISVAGPMPLDLGADETIIWIFNGVKSYRYPRSEGAGEKPPPSMPSTKSSFYFPPLNASSAKVSIDGLVEQGPGDLVVTNKTVLLVTENRQKKYPVGRMTFIEPLSGGFRIMRLTENRPVTFVVDDPWFAANLILTLSRLASDTDQSPADDDETATTIQAPIE